MPIRTQPASLKDAVPERAIPVAVHPNCANFTSIPAMHPGQYRVHDTRPGWLSFWYKFIPVIIIGIDLTPAQNVIYRMSHTSSSSTRCKFIPGAVPGECFHSGAETHSINEQALVSVWNQSPGRLELVGHVHFVSTNPRWMWDKEILWEMSLHLSAI